MMLRPLIPDVSTDAGSFNLLKLHAKGRSAHAAILADC